MAKKFGKVLFLTAALSGAAAAVYYYLRKKDEEKFISLDQVAPPQNDKDNGKNDPEVEEFFDEDDAEE